MEQKICCSVDCCEHIDASCKCCKLKSVKITNDSQVPTAHYCSNYCKK